MVLLVSDSAIHLAQIFASVSTQHDDGFFYMGLAIAIARKYNSSSGSSVIYVYIYLLSKIKANQIVTV